MNQSELVDRLDTYFNTDAHDDRELWSSLLPAKHIEVYESLARPGFVASTWNGLMLDSTPEVDRVYLIVLPGQAVLDTILARELERSAPGALIFAHYPADFEARERGFVPIREAQVDELREHRISYYCCHEPLDCHAETSTAIALAEGLKLHNWEPFAPHSGGMAAVHGRVSELDFGTFATQLAELTELPYLRYDQIRFNGVPVQHVAVMPGGGTPEHLEVARELGCDTWVTGQWWPFGDYEVAQRQREAMRDIVPRLPMNLIGTTLYASEMVVLRDQMIAWFRNAGIEAKFIRQPDPFR